MRKFLGLLIPFVILIVCGISGSAGAALVDRGGGMIYDTDMDITWLQDANYAMTSGYDSDGLMGWGGAKTWAENLVYGGYDNWRLPISDENCGGYNCAISEMGHLYYTDLGNSAGGPLTNTEPFTNLQSGYYWSDTVYDPSPGMAWFFRFSDGTQSAHLQTQGFYALAVRDGDVAPIVPEPISSILFVTGGAVLAGKRYLKKRRN